jgi:hypothetical protein
MSPKINLLPLERAEKAKGRQKVVLRVFLLLAYIGLLAFVFLMMKSRETQAEENLATQQAANELIKDDIAELRPFRILGEDYEAGVINLQAALNGDIAWGVLLQDFGRMISDEHVWIEGLAVSRVIPVEESVAYGSVQMSGSGFDYPDVASWLVTLDSDDWEAVGASWAASVTTGSVNDVETVGWSIQTALSDAALSVRVDDLTPEVP